MGVFIAFTLSQTGMVIHWTRLLKGPGAADRRRQMMRSRVINFIGAGMTGTVLVIVIATKFLRGAWIVCILILLLYLLMQAIHRHYQRVSESWRWIVVTRRSCLPSRVVALVLVSKIHKPTLRALSYAAAVSPRSWKRSP